MTREAAPAAERLRRQKICFIGMWSLRKGSRDWSQIMEGIWQRHPETEFVFLGTMSSEKVVRADLGFDQSKRITCLPTYDATDLPKLLADVTLGLFPSYVEGFGLAVLEQLAAGLPTVAYDVAGPHQILQSQSGWLLTPAGDPAAMAARAAEILALPLAKYEELATACHWDRPGIPLERDCRRHHSAISSRPGFVRPRQMKSPGAILQIVPRAPGNREGVGDYAWTLATGLRTRGYETTFVAAHSADGSEILAPLARISDEEWRRHRASAIVLHYVNYGYHARGVPWSLPKKIERIHELTGARLITIFHELYASGSWRQSAFWLRPLQKHIARVLARRSAACFASSAALAATAS